MDRSSGERRLASETDRRPAADSDSPPNAESEPASTSNAASSTLVSASRELEDVSFGAVVDSDPDGESRILWATPDGLEVVGRGVAARFTAGGADRFDGIRADAARAFDALEHDGPRVARPRAFGGVSFHAGHEAAPPWTGFEAASFVIPRVLVVRSDAGTWLTAVATDRDAAADRLERWTDRLADAPAMQASAAGPGVASTRRPTSREAWTEQVETALERIERGDLTKVVLAQSLSVDLDGPIAVPRTLERLRREYPNCYRFLIGNEVGGTFFGAPPERLVSKRGARVETEALAGSVPRGDTPEEDRSYADEMRDSEKFGREHGLVVDAIRDQLAPLARELSVDDRTIRRLANIQHLQTPISATLEGDRHVLELVEALHPTPAVGGVPPDAALETIRDLEPFDRGWYAAPVGWFDGDGDGEFAVGLRSGVATDETVTLFAGNGIVADSDPDEEWEEVQLKFRPILDELE